MTLKLSAVSAVGLRINAVRNQKVIGRAYLYFLQNDLHPEPFGFIEDVYVDERERGRGIGGELVERCILEARAKGCYKIICTSRHSRDHVHQLYQSLGFTNHGLEFRMDLK